MNKRLHYRWHYAWHYAWVVLAMVTLVVAGSLGLARFGYTLVLPSMQTALDLENAGAGGLATANLVGYLLMSVAGGALASRFGPRIVISAGLAVAAAGMVFTGLAGGFGSALVWRAVTGAGSGASNVPAMGLISAWFAKSRRGLAAGIGVTGSSLALIVLGSLVPTVLSAGGADGWRHCWFIYGGATLLLAGLAALILRNRPAVMGLAQVGNGPFVGNNPTGTPVQQSAGRADKRSWASVYRSRMVWHIGLIYVAFGFSYIIYMTFFSKHLVTKGGYTPLEAGRLFMTMGWVSLSCGLLWGWVSDVIGRKRTLVIVYMIQMAAFSLFALWPTPVGCTVSAVLFGLTAWSIPAIMAAICGDWLGPRLSPAGLGFVTLFFGVGQAAGPSVAGLMADATGSLSSAFLLAAVVALLGALGSLMLPGPREADGEAEGEAGMR